MGATHASKSLGQRCWPHAVLAAAAANLGQMYDACQAVEAAIKEKSSLITCAIPVPYVKELLQQGGVARIAQRSWSRLGLEL